MSRAAGAVRLAPQGPRQRTAWGGRGSAVLGALLIGTIAAGCTESGTDRSSAAASSNTSITAPSATASRGPCVVDPKGVPSCGALWGVATRPPTTSGVESVEKTMDRDVDFVYRYHDLNDEVPDAAEREQVEQGKLLHVAIAARDFSHPDRSQISWADVAAGDFDDDLIRQAKGVASLKVPVFVTFEQEANQARKVGVLGSTKDFVAAWQHVHDIYADAGTDNASWVWVMTGSEDNLGNAAQMWPGNDYVDWISWNVYNQSGCKGDRIDPSKYVSFEDKMKVFYDFVHEQGPGLDMDAEKPMMISETGSARYADDLQLTANWYAEIPDVLKRYPQIKAVSLWNSINGTCDYRFSEVPELASAVSSAGLDPWVDTKPTVAVG